MKTSIKDLNYLVTIDFTDLVERLSINLKTEKMIKCRDSLCIVVMREANGYKAYIVELESDSRTLVMQSDFNKKSDNDVFQRILNKINVLNFDTFLLAAAYYIESEEEEIEEWLYLLDSLDDEDTDFDEDELFSDLFEDGDEFSDGF